MSQGTAVFDFHGSKVLVTGGSNGIGYAIARQYLAAGAQVTITGTQPEAADYENDLAGLRYRQLRVQDRQQIETVVAELDALDILVNNAGASMPGGMDEWSADGFEESVRVNLFSAFHMSMACHPLLAASVQPGGASVVGIASLTSFFGNDIVPGYGAAKAGLAQLAKSQCMKWAADGIRSNAVAAGMTETRMTAIVKEIPEMNEPVIARTPMKRWGTPDEVASCVLFLSSAAASFIDGQTILVDGGYSISG